MLIERRGHSRGIVANPSSLCVSEGKDNTDGGYVAYRIILRTFYCFSPQRNAQEHEVLLLEHHSLILTVSSPLLVPRAARCRSALSGMLSRAMPCSSGTRIWRWSGSRQVGFHYHGTPVTPLRISEPRYAVACLVQEGSGAGQLIQRELL